MRASLSEIAHGIICRSSQIIALANLPVTDSGNWFDSFYRFTLTTVNNPSTKPVPELNWTLPSLNSRHPSRIKKNKRGNNQATRIFSCHCPYFNRGIINSLLFFSFFLFFDSLVLLMPEFFINGIKAKKKRRWITVKRTNISFFFFFFFAQTRYKVN